MDNFTKQFREKTNEYMRMRGGSVLADFFESDRKKLLFGMGKQATVCYRMCTQMGAEVSALLATSVRGKSIFLEEVPCASAHEFAGDREGSDVLLALSEKHFDEVCDLLRQEGYTHIYAVENWHDANTIYFESQIEAYVSLKEKKACDMQAEVFEIGRFRTKRFLSGSASSREMFIGEFFDIIVPGLYGDSQFVLEGEYENDLVSVKEGDIVFDLGAHIGLFSCVAASKGAEVYAFEPTPDTAAALRENAALYDCIHIEEMAVFNECGEIPFYTNEDTTDTGRNTIFSKMLPDLDGGKEIKVKMTSIDDFVRQQGIKHVDFIKADIEGSERYMLEGAREVLAKHAPALSLCTYHCKDDPEVMEKIILEANPGYVVKQGKNKLYAYVR